VSSTQEIEPITEEVAAVRHTRPPRRWWPPSWRERFWAAFTLFWLLLDACLAVLAWYMIRHLLMRGH